MCYRDTRAAFCGHRGVELEDHDHESTAAAAGVDAYLLDWFGIATTWFY